MNVTNCNWHTWNGAQGLKKEVESFENLRMNQDHPNYSIV